MVDRQAIFAEATKRAGAQIDTTYNAASAEAQQDTNPVTWALDAVNSAGLGIAKAGIETKEAIFGEPKYEDRWPLQKAVEADAAELDRRSGVNAFVGDTSQFVTGMLGAGKFIKGGSLAVNLVRGTVAGATVFDPQEERLSNFLESYPVLSNPVSQYLAANTTDSDAEGRFKSALEGMGMDIGLSFVFAASVKLFKAMKGGNPKAIEAATTELEAAQAQTLPQSPNLLQQELATQPAPVAAVTDDAAMAAIESGDGMRAPGPTAPPAAGPSVDLDADAMAAMEGGSVARPDVDADAMAAMEGTGYAPSSAPASGTIPPTPADPIADALTADMATPQGGPLAGGGNVVFDEMGNKATSPDGAHTTKVFGADGEVIGSVTREEGKPLNITVEGAGELQAGAPPKATPPGAGRAVEVPPEEQVDALLKGFDADMDAIEAHGSREAAELAGHRFGASGSLPWQKINDGGEGGLRAFTEQVAAVFEAELNAAKGGDVLTDKRVQRMLAQRAALYGDDPTALMGMIQQAGAASKSMVANMEAGYLVANKALMDVYRLATNIRMGNLTDFGGSAQMADQALKQRLAMAVEALAQSKAMTAAAGRSLRRMRGQFKITPEQLAALKDMDIENLVEVIHASKGNPKALASMAQPGFMDRLVRGAGSMMANNLLWGWPTHAVNIATAAYMGMVRPAEKIVGSYLVKNGGGMRQAALKEYAYMVSSMADARKFAVDAFLRGDSMLAPHQTEWFTAGTGQPKPSLQALGFKPLNTYRDFLHNGLTALDVGLGMPTRALGMIDEFIKQTSYRGYVQAKAAVRAEEMGLQGKDLAEFVQKALDDAFDGNFQAVDRDALHEAQVRTFSQPLQAKGSFGFQTGGAMLQNAVAGNPLLRAVFPFVRTPINVFRYAMKQTPGLNVLQKEYRDMLLGKLGPEQQAQAYGQMFVGSLTLGAFSMLAMNGKVTGSGPNEPGLRKALEATGWKAYSFISDNGDGTHTYIPYNRFDPVGMLAGMATDITEMMVTYPDREGDADNLATAAVLAIVKNLSDKTYLQSINGVIDALSDPDKNGNKWAGQLAESLIPFSSAMRNYANPDPHMREARTLMDHMLDRMPGFSQNLPPQRDPFGYPVKIRTGLVFQDNADDIVDAEQIRMFQETGAGLAVPVAYQMDGVDLRDLQVEGPEGPTTAYDRYLEIAIQPEGSDKPMKEAVAEVIRSETYQMAPDGVGSEKGTRLSMVQQVIQKYRAAAKKQLLREYPEEVATPVGERSKEVREAWRQTQSGTGTGGGAVQALLAGYGIK